MNKIRRYRWPSILNLIYLSSHSAYAFPFLYTGVRQIADSGAGVLSASDASSTMVNPASLANATRTGSYADLSIVSVNYTYAHTNYDPVFLKTVAPPINLGANLTMSSGLNFGFLMSPRSAPGVKPMRLNDVPTYTGDGYALFDLDFMQTGFMAGAGVGYKLPRASWSLGASLLYSEDGQEITAYANESDHSVPGMDLKYSGASYQGVFGLVYAGDATSLGVTFRTSATRHYRGDIASALTDNIYDHFRGISYQPSQIASALERKVNRWSYLLQLSRDFWSRGRSIVNRGLPYSSAETDFKDSFGVISSLKHHSSSWQTYSVSCGHYSANTGDGSSKSELRRPEDSAIPAQTGMEFGQMEAIPRYVFGVGFSQSSSDNSSNWMFSGNYQTGTRIVPVGHKGEGWYHLEVVTVAGGVRLEF